MEKEGGDEVHQEPVQEAVGQQHDVISASEGQKIVKRPSRPRRWVQKGKCPMQYRLRFDFPVKSYPIYSIV